jgi:hypothetical protein
VQQASFVRLFVGDDGESHFENLQTIWHSARTEMQAALMTLINETILLLMPEAIASSQHNFYPTNPRPSQVAGERRYSGNNGFCWCTVTLSW